MGQLGINLTSSDGLIAQHGVGDTHWHGGTQRQYFLAGAAIAAFALCTVDNTLTALEGTTTTATATKPTVVCVPQFAVAIGEYFWAPIGPVAQANWDGATTFKVLAANALLNVKMYTTATAGVLDDAVSTGFIEGLFLSATVTTQAATAFQATQKISVNSQS